MRINCAVFFLQKKDFDLSRYGMVAFFIATRHCILLFVSSIVAFHYFTMWREESLIRRRKPMSGSVMRLCKRFKSLKIHQFSYEYVLDW